MSNIFRVKQCCCGCTLDIGVRVILWTDFILACIAAIAILTLAARGMLGCTLSLLLMGLISVKLLYVILAITGINVKISRRLRPYVIYNVMVLFAGAVMISIAILKFNWLVDSHYMDDIFSDVIFYSPEGQLVLDDDNFRKYVKMSILLVLISFSIFNLFTWIYFTIVVYSYYKVLEENGDNLSTDRIAYFAHVEQTGPILKNGFDGPPPPQSGYPPMYGLLSPPQYNLQPSTLPQPPRYED